MQYLSSFLFLALAVVGITFFVINAKKIYRNIKLGQPVNRTDNSSERLKNMLLIAFGQKKMFSRPIPALLHLAIYVAFIITQIELIEIFIDGIFGTHRVFKDSLGQLYTFIISLIEIVSLGALIATIAFLSRRNLLKLPRLNKEELLGWPKKDGNIILMMELVLVFCIFTMNGTDEALYNMGASHYGTGTQGSFGFAISQHLGPAIFGSMSEGTLHILERVGWWGHFAMVLAFLNYLYFSKHLHILLAFPNTYFANLKPLGQLDNLQSVTNEVKLMMDPNADPFAAPDADAAPAKFGASDVQDLNWVQLLNAYSCTECGRCTSSCPANITGKKLSPRNIMMKTRDRLEEVGKNIDLNKGTFVDDGKSLLNDYITPEELWACTSCNACVQECPIDINPLSIIMDMRRYLVMEQSAAPMELNTMMTNIENNGAPWQYNQMDRLNWKDEN